jgi:hypothetical protein
VCALRGSARKPRVAGELRVTTPVLWRSTAGRRPLPALPSFGRWDGGRSRSLGRRARRGAVNLASALSQRNVSPADRPVIVDDAGSRASPGGMFITDCPQREVPHARAGNCRRPARPAVARPHHQQPAVAMAKVMRAAVGIPQARTPGSSPTRSPDRKDRRSRCLQIAVPERDEVGARWPIDRIPGCGGERSGRLAEGGRRANRCRVRRVTLRGWLYCRRGAGSCRDPVRTESGEGAA